MKAPARIGIIGLGRAGSIHLEALREVPRVTVAAVFDTQAAARQRAGSLGIPAYSDLKQMLAAEPLDAVLVCTPPSSHSALAVRCLESGLHVLCEKPLALTTWDVLTMLQTANRENKKVLVASKFRHVPEVARARELILQGAIGQPVSFEISFCSPVDMAGRWNSQLSTSGGGVIIDNGCHAFDIICYLFGSIRRVHATRLRVLQPLNVEDSATLQVWAGEGVIGRIDLSWSIATPRDSYLVVHGSNGTVQVGWQLAGLKQTDGTWQEIGGSYDKIGAHRAMLRSFVDGIRNGHAPWISAAECLQAVAAVDAAYRSFESGMTEWVSIQGARELSLVSSSTPGRDAVVGL